MNLLYRSNPFEHVHGSMNLLYRSNPFEHVQGSNKFWFPALTYDKLILIEVLTCLNSQLLTIKVSVPNVWCL